MARSAQHLKPAAMTWRSLLSALLVLSVFLGPYAFAGDGHAQEHDSQSSTNHHDDPVPEDHSGIGHALTHCGSASCTPSFVGTFFYVATYTTVSHRLRLQAGDDAMLRSPYLDADPPVPRGGFSKA